MTRLMVLVLCKDSIYHVYVPRQQQGMDDYYYSATGITLPARAEEYDSVWDIDLMFFYGWHILYGLWNANCFCLMVHETFLFD